MMKTAARHPHNPIADTPARNTRDTHTLWQRCLVAIALLVTCVLGVKAETQYTICHNGQFYAAFNPNGRKVLATETFDEATCVWTLNDAGEIYIIHDGTTYYLNRFDGTIDGIYTAHLTADVTRTSTWIIDEGKLYTPVTILIWTYNYYLQYDGSWKFTSQQTNGGKLLTEYVTGPTTPEPERITINPKSISLLVGEKATVTYTISPEGAHEDIRYTINDDNVASVDENGVITAKSVGNAILRVTAYKSDGTEARYDECEITVTILDPEEISVGDLNLIVGETETISYTLKPAGAYDRVEFYIADESIATIGINDVVTGKKAGSTSLITTARNYDGSVACSVTSTINVEQRCATPTIHIERTTKEVTITCSEPADATIYYTTDGTDPTIARASQVYTGPFTITGGMVKAIAVRDGWADSHVGIATLGGNGENAGDPYQVSSTADLNYVSQHPMYHYKVVADFDASGFSGAIDDFSGTFDGGFYTISGLTSPLFATTNGATIKNVVLDSLNITGGTGNNVGAIAGTASGATRIYNCGVLSGTIGGSANVGSIAGNLDGEARVINCYSFADITGETGAKVGGIVGNNRVAYTTGSPKTLVMNCIFYGSLSGAADKYPIFGGYNITNNQGENTYNFFRYDENTTYAGYNAAQAVFKDEYLDRFGFYQRILDSHRELAAYYTFNDVSNVDEIGKWTLDRTRAPYPIVTKHLSNTRKTLDRTIPHTEEAYAGKKVKDINVTININGTTVYNGNLPVTDMDTARWDYTYGKVVLPFANEFTGWSIGDAQAITGWKISTNDYYYNKNNVFDNKNYVYAQGGNYIVPEGVTALTLTAYVAPAVYLSDASYDIVYNSSYGSPQGRGGATPTTYKGQTVYNTLANAIDALTLTSNTTRPYEQAIVLVGNYHYNQSLEPDVLPASWQHKQFNTNRPFTLMSADKDNDQEPDYCFYQYHKHGSGRTLMHPVRFDFLAAPGIGMAAHVEGGGGVPSIGIWHCKGWFELTETYLGIMQECEIRPANFITESPWILNGGIFEEINMSSTHESYYENTKNSKLTYMRIGGNAYINNFYPGTQSKDASFTTPMKPINMSGGEVVSCYMTGKQPEKSNTSGNVNFYCNGGYIHEFLGAYQEPLATNCDINIFADHALIDNFFGGGANENGTTPGNINININNSHIDFFCGGPKFGNMAQGKKVTINATGTTFGEFYGGGYGGTALTRKELVGESPSISGNREYNISFDTYNRLEYSTLGIAVNYYLQYFLYAGGGNGGVQKFSVDYARLSLATVQGDIETNLTDCIILSNFYGGGSQGRVVGNITSTLNNCEVRGSAFAAGYTAKATPCIVATKKKPVYSSFIYNLGFFTSFGEAETEEFYWKAADDSHQVGSHDDTNKYLYTTAEKITQMGEVNGDATIKIKGASVINGSVFGGGNESKVIGNTYVHIQGGTIDGNVFGAGNQAEVTGKTEVIIGEQQVTP